MVYAIITGTRKYDLEIQIIVETLTLAQREIKDLRKMGCDDVRVKPFADETAAYEWVEKNS